MESGDGMYNMGGVTQGVGKTRQKECRQAGVSPNDCSAYILARSGDRAQNIASILLPTTKEEVAFTVATAGGGYVLKVAGKAGVKVIRYFKSKKELDEAVAKAKRVSRTDTRAGHEPDNDLLSNPVSGRREYYNFNLMSKTEAEEIAAKISVRSPIKVPHNATTKIEQKAAGYAQIKYTWVKDGVKYESRWHTRTLGAPANQTNSWVVTRKIQGSRTQKAGDTEYLLSNGQWVSESKWNNALKLRKQGKETRDSRDILDRGHIKDVE
ncbi:Uncharacterised protein [Moraxella lacunata]|uniref:Uncharacterized protein n=2 Tax=Moraxella lacunata TaxID=477 RepID=A0A378UDQ6_MORLA|nr:Uncharacterised protein [Moraxella lacunata]